MTKFKKGGFMKLLMFISSYFPLYIMMLVLFLGECDNVFKKPSIGQYIFFIIMVIAIILSVFSIYLLFKSRGSRYLEYNKAEHPDDMVISYIFSYIIPMLSIDNISKITILVNNLLLFTIIGYLYICMDLIYLNPLWSVMGYISYKVDEDIILITNIPYDRIRKTKKLYGFFLSNRIFVAHKKENIEI